MILKIGKEIKPPKCIYKLVITNMHGDADGFSDVAIMLKEESEVIKIINFINWYNSSANIAYGKYRFILDKVAEIFGKEDLPDWMAWDSTCDDYVATPRFTSLTYFNEDGKEFKVNVYDFQK
jgi:hypothetical protein